MKQSSLFLNLTLLLTIATNLHAVKVIQYDSTDSIDQRKNPTALNETSSEPKDEFLSPLISDSDSDSDLDQESNDNNNNSDIESDNNTATIGTQTITNEPNSDTELDDNTEIVETPAVDTELQEAINFCRSEESVITGYPVFYATQYTEKQTISKEERSTAKKTLTDGLHELYKKNSTDFEQLQQLIVKALPEKLKTNTLINALIISENIFKRFKVANSIILNKANIQLNEEDLALYNDLWYNYTEYAKTIFAQLFDFEANKLFRLDRIRRGIQKKSLKPGDVEYTPLTKKLVISQIIGEEFNDENNSDENDSDENDSDIDSETCDAANYYDLSWWSPKRGNIRKGLRHAREKTKKSTLSTATKEITDSLQILIQDSDECCAIDSLTAHPTPLQTSIVTRMKNSENKQRKLAAARFLFKSSTRKKGTSEGIQFTEADLLDFNKACKRGQNFDILTLQNCFASIQSTLEKGNVMCEQIVDKSLSSMVKFKKINTASKNIFSSAQELFEKQKNQATEEQEEIQKKLAAAVCEEN
ncbi:MAG: hypothetical protein WCD44_02170 [Candidatus Babeliales bacterium]